MHHIFLLLLCICITTGTVLAQLDNSFFYDDYTLEKQDSGKIKFGFEFMGFLQNNEFSQQVIPGYTLFGYQFRPYISFSPAGNVRIEAGGFMNKDFGNENFSEIRPVLSVQYQNNGFSLIFGTLEGALSHRLIEPVYDFENIIRRRIEDGLQLKYVKDRVYTDIWVEWINMIEFGDPEQEEFNAGLSFRYTLVDLPGVKVEVPFQLMANHMGGQIDISNATAGTIFNSSPGIGLIVPLRKNGMLHAVRSELYLSFYDATDPVKNQPVLSGSAYYINLTGAFKWFDIMISYWNGDDYYAPYGSALYRSPAFDYEVSGYYEENRNLLIGRILYEKKLSGGMSLGIRFQPIYDINNQLFDHMESLFLRFRTDFILNRKQNSEL